MTEGSNSAGILRSYIERIERLNGEIDGLNADKSEVFKEAKSTGFDPAVMRKLIAERKDPAKAREQSEILETYRAAVGTGIALTHVQVRE